MTFPQWPIRGALADKALAKTAGSFKPSRAPHAPRARNTASIDTRDQGAVRVRKAT